MEPKTPKKFFVSEIIVSDLVSLNFSYEEQDTFRHISDHVFGVSNFKNTKSMRVIFLFKYV